MSESERTQPVDLAPLRKILEERYSPHDYREAQELVVGACQEAQHLYGWVPPEAAELIAQHLGVTINRIYGLLTFYADFRTEPPGRHFLWLCHGAACYVAGASRLIELLAEEYGVTDHGTTADGVLTLHVFNGCLGVCDLAPAAQLDLAKYIGRLTPERLRELIASLRSESAAGGLHGSAE